MSEEKTNLLAVDRKLSAIVSLLLKIANEGEKQSLKDQVEYLSSFGLDYNEIALILRKKPSHVSKELSGIRKSR